MNITLIKSPDASERMLMKRCVWVTMGRTEEPAKPPSSELLRKLLTARHSPIRVLTFAFLLEGIPSNTATHLARHVHAIPFISSLRNDRQSAIDGDTAPRNTPVNMIWYVNAEELQIIANKRLCNKAAQKTREVVKKICDLAEEAMPELKGLLVPDCERHQGKCFEIDPCWRATNT